MSCEKCEKEDATIEFVCMLPSFGLYFRALVCIGCIADAEHDIVLASDIMKKRAKERNIPLPAKDLDVLIALTEPTKAGEERIQET
jgi:hypothetical protein